MKENTVINLERPDIRRTEIPIFGTAPLIMHKWSEKARKQMLDKAMKKASTGREAKNPEEEYRGSLYVMDNGKYGFPSIGFKAAMVRAGTYSNLPMTFLRGAFHVNGEFVEIIGEPNMREDTVRVGIGGAENRFRGEFKSWSATLPIIYNAKAISLEQITNLVIIAGFSVGIGDWRPEKDGQFGTFTIEEK